MMDVINGVINGNTEITALVVSTILVGLLKLLDGLGFPKRFIPIASIFLGVLLATLYLSGDFKKGLLIGIWLGLGAIGIHSGLKNTFALKEDDTNNKYTFSNRIK